MGSSYQVDGIPIHRLSLETLHKIDDGELAAAFALGLQRMARSCVEDPGIAKPRELTIKVTLRPGRRPADVQVGVVIAAVKVPGFLSAAYPATLRPNGDVTFTQNGSDPDQQVMNFEGVEHDKGSD